MKTKEFSKAASLSIYITHNEYIYFHSYSQSVL